MNSDTEAALDVSWAGSVWSVSADQTGTLRLASKVMGVERTGEAPRPRSGSAACAALAEIATAEGRGPARGGPGPTQRPARPRPTPRRSRTSWTPRADGHVA